MSNQPGASDACASVAPSIQAESNPTPRNISWVDDEMRGSAVTRVATDGINSDPSVSNILVSQAQSLDRGQDDDPPSADDLRRAMEALYRSQQSAAALADAAHDILRVHEETMRTHTPRPLSPRSARSSNSSPSRRLTLGTVSANARARGSCSSCPRLRSPKFDILAAPQHYVIDSHRPTCQPVKWFARPFVSPSRIRPNSRVSAPRVRSDRSSSPMISSVGHSSRGASRSTLLSLPSHDKSHGMTRGRPGTSVQ